MFDKSIITIIFRLLNFAALIGLGLYVFQKYFRKEIEKSIVEEQLKEIETKQHIINLEQNGIQLSEKITEQEQLCEHLIAQADQWKTAFQKDARLHEQDQQLLLRQAAQRVKKQAQAIAKERVLQAVLPQALEHTRSQLKATFEQPAHNTDFVRNILDQMKKEA